MNAKLHFEPVVHHHHVLRVIVLALLALLAYLVWTDTASGEVEPAVDVVSMPVMND